MLVGRAIRLMAEDGVLQGHAAALADQLIGRAQQGIDGNVIQPGQELERFRIGHGFAVFPAGHRLPGHKYLFRHVVLGQAVPGSELIKHIPGIHAATSLSLLLLYNREPRGTSNWLLLPRGI